MLIVGGCKHKSEFFTVKIGINLTILLDYTD
jgi:hypothetical protein